MSFYEDASWLLIPSGIEEDVVFAQKPISGLGDLTYTRASDATYTDASGVVRRSPYNLTRFSEMFTDASWTKTNTSISANVTTAPNGTLTADKIIAANGTSIVGDHIEQNVTKGASAISYTFTTYAKANELNGTRIYVRDSISAANFAQVYFNLITGTIDTAATSGGNFSNASATITANVNGWYRVSLTFTSSTDTQILARIYTYDTVKTTGNGTDGIFIWGAQLVEGTSALDYFPTTNRQDVPRIDFRNADGTLSSCGRLLLEPQRTNSIRNSSMVGALAGTPGTAPTNWIAPTGTGLTQTVVGIGNENGIPYIDLRFNGTAIGTTNQISFETTNFIAATTGQTWAGSFWFKIISAPNPPTGYNIRFREATAAGTFVADGIQAFTPNTTLQRFNYVRTNTGGVTTERIQPMILIGQTNGATYDYTIRIAAPQMELGGYATTWVPTTTAAVTRIADVANKTGVSSLIGQTEGTFYAEVNMTAVQNSVRSIFTIQDGLNYTRFRITAGGAVNFETFFGGSFIAQLTTGGVLNGNNKLAFSYKNGEGTRVFLNGSLLNTTVVVTTNPTGSEIKLGIDNFNGVQFANGITQAALFPTRLQNAQLAELTTL